MLSNYEKTARRAAEAFLRYDAQEMAQKFSLRYDGAFLYLTFLSAPYRVSCETGIVECLQDGRAVPAGFDESMTIYDVLCDAKSGHSLSGRFCRINSVRGVAQTAGLGEGMLEPRARSFDRAPQAFCRACRMLGGIQLTGADAAYRLPLFPFLPVELRFWHSDEEFPPSLQLLWDENILQYMRYETTYYAAGHLMRTLQRLAGEK